MTVVPYRYPTRNGGKGDLIEKVEISRMNFAVGSFYLEIHRRLNNKTMTHVISSIKKIAVKNIIRFYDKSFVVQKLPQVRSYDGRQRERN